MERLLLNALIEARSCECLRLVWKYLEDLALRDFYYDMMLAEVGHYTVFRSLAKTYHPEVTVDTRRTELIALESEIVNVLPSRLHWPHRPRAEPMGVRCSYRCDTSH